MNQMNQFHQPQFFGRPYLSNLMYTQVDPTHLFQNVWLQLQLHFMILKIAMLYMHTHNTQSKLISEFPVMLQF